SILRADCWRRPAAVGMPATMWWLGAVRATFAIDCVRYHGRPIAFHRNSYNHKSLVGRVGGPPASRDISAPPPGGPSNRPPAADMAGYGAPPDVHVRRSRMARLTRPTSSLQRRLAAGDLLGQLDFGHRDQDLGAPLEVRRFQHRLLLGRPIRRHH